nr:hypothetical protein [Zunongwangia pacifica]
MVDVFESISASEKNEILVQELMETQSIFEQVFNITKQTGFYEAEDHLDLVKAIDIETKNDTVEDELMEAWTMMVANINAATTQEEFNARFALFTPVILKKMNAFKISNPE